MWCVYSLVIDLLTAEFYRLWRRWLSIEVVVTMLDLNRCDKCLFSYNRSYSIKVSMSLSLYWIDQNTLVYGWYMLCSIGLAHGTLGYYVGRY